MRRNLPRVPAALLLVLSLALAACGHKVETPSAPTVAALESDPILLSRVLGRCNANPQSATSTECINARAAVDRNSAADDAKREKKAETSFEMARDARRRADDAARQAHDATEKRASPYDLPVEGEKPAATAP